MSLSQALPGRRLSQHCVRACGGHGTIFDRRQHCPTATPLLQALPGRRLSQHLLRHSARHCKDTRMRARAKRALDRSRLKRRIAQTDEAVLRQRTVSRGEDRLLHGAMPQRWCGACTAQCRSGGVCVEPAAPDCTAQCRSGGVCYSECGARGPRGPVRAISCHITFRFAYHTRPPCCGIASGRHLCKRALCDAQNGTQGPLAIMRYRGIARGRHLCKP